MIKAQWETTVDGHAGEKETSAILAIRPDLVREALPTDGEGMPLNRLKDLRDAGARRWNLVVRRLSLSLLRGWHSGDCREGKLLAGRASTGFCTGDSSHQG